MDYKKMQQEAKRRKRQGWLACGAGDGTRRVRHLQARTRGKAQIKAKKRLTHTKGFYRQQREAMVDGRG